MKGKNKINFTILSTHPKQLKFRYYTYYQVIINDFKLNN